MQVVPNWHSCSYKNSSPLLKTSTPLNCNQKSLFRLSHIWLLAKILRPQDLVLTIQRLEIIYLIMGREEKLRQEKSLTTAVSRNSFSSMPSSARNLAAVMSPSKKGGLYTTLEPCQIIKLEWQLFCFQCEMTQGALKCYLLVRRCRALDCSRSHSARTDLRWVRL